MHTHLFRHRLVASYAIASILSCALLPATVHAIGNASFEFRPHCEGDDLVDNAFGGPSPDVQGMTKLAEGTCLIYDVRDPMSMQTPKAQAGDTLDMDIVLNNPDAKAIERFRVWVAYDPTVLQGLDATVSSAFPVPTPGESGFTDNNGTLKLSGTATTPVTKERFPVAHIRFKVLKDTLDGTPLTFTDRTEDADSKTGVFESQNPNNENILLSALGSLYVRLAGVPSPAQTGTDAAPASETTQGASDTHDAATSTATSSGNSSSSSSPKAAVTQKAFNLLQVLGLRVTTDGSSVFLAWDNLPSSELAGYNVYYGTVTGHYIQRRTVDKAANSLTIRALPVGTTYYFAIRAYNATGEETVFSQEVGVSVGNPRTSTSPLAANSLPTKTPQTGGQVSGETGVSSTLLMMILGCAAVGTMIAVRRQTQVSSIS